MKIIDWLKRLFHIKTVTNEELNAEMVRSQRAIGDISGDNSAVEVEPVNFDKEIADAQRKTEALKQDVTKMCRSSRTIGRNIGKELRQQAIREKNLEKQRSTLGYGLKSRNFKPRPAFEKKTWKLDKKPEDD